MIVQDDDFYGKVELAQENNSTLVALAAPIAATSQKSDWSRAQETFQSAKWFTSNVPAQTTRLA